MTTEVDLDRSEQLALVRLASSTGHLATMAWTLTDEDVSDALGPGQQARLASGALAKIRAALERPAGSV